MLHFNLFVMSVQINGVVPLVDVMHLVRARTPRPSVGYVDYHTILEKRLRASYSVRRRLAPHPTILACPFSSKVANMVRSDQCMTHAKHKSPNFCVSVENTYFIDYQGVNGGQWRICRR